MTRDHRASLLLTDAGHALDRARERAAETSTCAGRCFSERDRREILRLGMEASAALDAALQALAAAPLPDVRTVECEACCRRVPLVATLVRDGAVLCDACAAGVDAADPWGLADPVSHERAAHTDSERVAAVECAACGEPTDPAEMQERERAGGPVCGSCRLDIDEADALRAYPGHAAVGGAR